MIIMIDASCSKFYTHNSSYMLTYAKRAAKMFPKEKIIFWIGESADNETIRNFSDSVFPILRSPIYSYTRDFTFFYLRDLLLNWVAKLISNLQILGFIQTVLENSVFYFFTRIPVKQTKVLSEQGEKLSFILPSADGLTLRIIQRIIELGYPVQSVHIRTLAAESRGIYGIDDFPRYFLNLQQSNPKIEFKVGWESHVIAQGLLESGIKSGDIYWAPMPTSRETTYKLLNSPLKIGFLGAARKNKGFELIPRILNILVGSNMVVYVQLASQPWPGYSDILLQIENQSQNIKFIKGGIAHIDLLQIIASVDVLILPYSFLQYEKMGSGILYQGADHLVPSISFKQLGFSWDIEHFGIGATINDLSELKEILNSKNVLTWRANIEKYNAQRNVAVDSFLSRKVLLSE
jgi:hypothetical protein